MNFHSFSHSFQTPLFIRISITIQTLDEFIHSQSFSNSFSTQLITFDHTHSISIIIIKSQSSSSLTKKFSTQKYSSLINHHHSQKYSSLINHHHSQKYSSLNKFHSLSKTLPLEPRLKIIHSHTNSLTLTHKNILIQIFSHTKLFSHTF